MSKPDASSKKKKYTPPSDQKPNTNHSKDLKSHNERTNPRSLYTTTPGAPQLPSSTYQNANNQLRNKKNLRFSDKKRHRQTAGGFEEPKKTYFPQFGCEEYIPSRFDYLRNNLCIKTGIANQEALKFQMKKITLRNYTPKILNQEVNMGMWI